MVLPDFIEVGSDVMMRKPCLKGTRIPVQAVLEKLGAGETADQVLAACPQLKPEHLRAALQYAAQLACDETIRRSADFETRLDQECPGGHCRTARRRMLPIFR